LDILKVFIIGVSIKSPSFLQPQEFHCGLSDDFTIRHLQKMSQSFSNNINSFNTIVNVSITNNPTPVDDRDDLLCWISPLDPKLKHQDIQARRVENVGEWLLQTEEFRSWETGSGGDESDNAVLFCHGDPGVGKTYLK